MTSSEGAAAAPSSPGRSADESASRPPRLSERQALQLSVWVALVMSAVAIVGGLAVGSRVIVFDGVYGAIGLAMTWLALRASRAVDEGPTPRYPFGRESLTPLVIVLQGVALVGTLLLAAVDAVLVILDGGTDTLPLSVVIYGALSGAASLLLAQHLLRRGGHSELVRVEALQWRAGALRNGVMLLGAVVAILLTSTVGTDLVRYLDPVLVLIAVAMLAPLPASFLRSGLGELLEGAPSALVQRQVAEAIDAVRAEHGLPEPLVRVTKLGRKLYLEIAFLVDSGRWTIDDQDAVRRGVLARLEVTGYEVWASIDLTSDPTLAD